VVLAAAALAATFALLTKFLTRQLSDSTALVFVAAGTGLVRARMRWRGRTWLALPVMVLWGGGADRWPADRRGRAFVLDAAMDGAVGQSARRFSCSALVADRAQSRLMRVLNVGRAVA